MKKTILTALTIMAMTACTTRENPFLTVWDTPYGIPPFDKITEADYIPAIKAGITQQQGEIQDIIDNTDAPTFDNTIAALDRSGSILAKVEGVLFNLCETDATDKLNAVVEEATPIITDWDNSIFMNEDLFRKVKAVYDAQEDLNLTSEQKMLLKQTYRGFAQNGIALPADQRARLKDINSEISMLQLKFGNNLLAESNAFAERFGISVSDYPETMAATADRSLREQMFRAYSMRGNNDNEYDNKQVILDIIRLRIEKAQLLGYDTPAALSDEDKMAKNPETIDPFLQSIITPAIRKAKEEIRDMQEMMDLDIKAGILPEGSKIEAWDWAYYTEKVRVAKYALDEEMTKPYFQMEKVRAGVFATAAKLYDLQFEPLSDIPVYHPEVEGFKVTRKDGSLVGILLTDYFPRSTKRGGAWMNNFRNQYVTVTGEDVRPIIVNVGNFAKPTADKPALLSIDNIETMFHEFGHALHGLLSECRYNGTSGTAVPTDFVEMLSQINENWAFEPEVLATYATHYQSGEVIPAELVEKINKAGTFNQGFMTTELAAASILDMKWHELKSIYVDKGCEWASETPAPDNAELRVIDPVKFEKHVCEQMGLIGEIIPRYRTTYFNHIFNSGYSAGYYSYLWAEVLDQDGFELFRQNGIFDKATANSLKENILSKGGSDEAMELFHRFRGADPDFNALLKARGLE